ncbi:MAG: alpha/beta fold hydrolase [Metallibacterium sp.]
MTATAEPLRIALPGFGLDLAALAWGDAHAPPLLALHGWLDNAASFAALAPLLAARYRIIALDLPGHGHSAHVPPAARYDLALYVASVREAAAALRLMRFTLLGHSLGGAVASLYAAAFPAQITRLALIEALGPLADDGNTTLQRWRSALTAPTDKSARVFPNVEQALAARCRSTGQQPDAIRAIVARGLRQQEGGWVWRSDARLTATTPVRMAESQVHALLAGIAAPTWLLLAEPESPWLPHTLLRARAACVPRITIDTLAGGHHLHGERPAQVAARLRAFLHRGD